MGFDREAKRHFLISLAFFVESCICDCLTRAVRQSYINKSCQIDVNWSSVGHGVGLFGILYLRQWYDNRELVIRWLYRSREVVVAFVIESQRVTATNMAAWTYVRA